jgi:hypothetical protein
MATFGVSSGKPQRQIEPVFKNRFPSSASGMSLHTFVAHQLESSFDKQK